MTEDAALLRIGEVARRVGASEHVLRAWERRYGLLRPVRTAGGFRLYTEADVRRVRRMLAHLADGLSAAEAARASLAQGEPSQPAGWEPLPAPQASGTSGRGGFPAPGEALAASLDRFDEAGAQAAFDGLLARFTVEAVLRDVVVPYLHELGVRWERGEVDVAQEHFASNVIRGRMTALARGWGRGRGPRAVLACAPCEGHDIPLVVFGIVLHRSGWAITYLGADTPWDDLASAVHRLRPDATVVVAATPAPVHGADDQLRRLAKLTPLALAGAGMTAALAARTGARLLSADPVTAAEGLAGAGPVSASEGGVPGAP